MASAILSDKRQAAAGMHGGETSISSVRPFASSSPRHLDIAARPGEAVDGAGRAAEAATEADLAASASSPPTSPPYWLNSSVQHGQRSTSNLSVDSVLPAGAITLCDNDTTEGNDRSDACWAKSVEIVDYTTVNGSTTNIGAFVVWIVKVETLTGSYMNIRKRYSEFDELRRQLVLSFPNYAAAMPVLPPKSIISRFRPTFLEKRRAGLQYFLNCIILNPEFSGSPVLKEFLFA
ncbi:hypothetical protein RJ55_05076 [Drechmeria coniospora]|nr:hypothetical protein RJ55_05076 [Drechmeria coniospora]